jgi:DNA-directed RNA polymerase specialized sigma24 family protein
MTNPPSPTPDSSHPLESDPDRLERIVDVMWAVIHKVLYRTAPPRTRSAGSRVARLIGEPATDRVIQGGTSPTDILSEAVAALLSTPEHKLTESWEAFAIGIARNKTKAALRAGQAGLRATEHRPQLTVVSGDELGSPSDNDELSASAFDVIADPNADPEAEFIETNQQLELIRLIREILDDRDRAIFLGMHFQGRSRASLAEEFDLTPPGVTYIYRRVAQRLYEHPRFQRYAEGGSP